MTRIRRTAADSRKQNPFRPQDHIRVHRGSKPFIPDAVPGDRSREPKSPLRRGDFEDDFLAVDVNGKGGVR